MLFDIAHVRDDIINTQHVIFGKHQACIYNKRRTVFFNHHHIEADFSQAA